jgi:MYXO-CTERM domain-containing protein
MTFQMRSARPLWLMRRFPPISRYGYGMLIDGRKRNSNTQMGAGLAMIVAGLALQRRRRPRSLLYSTELGVGESLAIRVVKNGEVVSETVVPGPVA